MEEFLSFFKGFSISSFISSYVVLFAIMNIPGSVPIILNLEKKGKIINARKAAIAVFIIYFCFFFAGEAFLKLFGVDISSFAIAGAIIVFVIGMCMTLDISIGSDAESSHKDATIVPVVFPLMIGAGALTALLSLRSQFSGISILLAVCSIAITVYIAIKSAKKLRKLLGEGFIATAQKVFGFILVAMAVKLFTSNIAGLIKSLSATM